MAACTIRRIRCARGTACSGRRMLYEYCASHGVPHRQCGKLIVATSTAELAKIESIHKQGLLNGVEGLELMYGNAVTALEPALACIAAVHSPHTGIIDSHALMLALQGDLEDRGGMIAFGTRIERLAPSPEGWDVAFGGDEPGTLLVDAVINSAGLDRACARARHRGLSRLSARRSSYSRRAITSVTPAGPRSRG